ncbi:MAG TPA: MlaD family protein [Solirubrobacteraceae bacterium]|jgi:virulence factor Mce-like protein
MQKRAPTLGNILVIALFALSCFGLLLFLWESFGGPAPLKSKGYRFTATFPRTLSLAEQSEVTIKGVVVGHVISLKAERSGLSHVVAEVDSRYAPLQNNDRLMIRQKTLLGETYLEVIPGKGKAPALANEAALPRASVEPFVTLDDILSTFKPNVREAFKTWMISSAEGVNGRGEQINAGFAVLHPFVEGAGKLLTALVPQQEAVQTLIKDTGTIFDSLTETDGQLRELAVQGERTFSAAANASAQFAEAFSELPAFEQGSEAVLRSANKLSRVANPLLDQLRPAERALTPLLQQVKSFAPPFDELLTALGPLTSAGKRGLPTLATSLKLTEPLLEALRPVLHNFDPLFQYLGEYLPELQSLFANFTAATQARLGASNITSEAVGIVTKPHYLRAMQYVGPESLAVYASRLGISRSNPYPHEGALNNLASGLEVFDSSNCADSAPAIEGPANANVSQELIEELLANKVVNAPGSTGNGVAAPACKQQGPFTFNGKTSQFPHVTNEESE